MAYAVLLICFNTTAMIFAGAAHERHPQARAHDAAAVAGVYVGGAVGSTLIVLVLSIVLLFALGVPLFGAHVPGEKMIGLLATLALGAAAFTTLGIAAARLVAKPENGAGPRQRHHAADGLHLEHLVPDGRRAGLDPGHLQGAAAAPARRRPAGGVRPALRRHRASSGATCCRWPIWTRRRLCAHAALPALAGPARVTTCATRRAPTRPAAGRRVRSDRHADAGRGPAHAADGAASGSRSTSRSCGCCSRSPTSRARSRRRCAPLRGRRGRRVRRALQPDPARATVARPSRGASRRRSPSSRRSRWC